MERHGNLVKPKQVRKPGQIPNNAQKSKESRNRGSEWQMSSQTQENSRGRERPDELDEALDAENQ
jgi:hypothetical protein